jgi:ABC-type multidrug transport system fused ATPase/permease subunit
MFSKRLTKISKYFFKDILLKHDYFFKDFNKIIEYSDIDENFITYLSNILFISLFSLIFIEFVLIYLMIVLNILFNLFSFFITIFISFTFSFMIFLLLYRYPYYLVDSKKSKISEEFSKTIKHLSVLKDEKLTVHDVLNVFLNIEENYFLSKDAKKILLLESKTKNLKDTLKSVISSSYSEVEKNFFRKLIDVIDKKENLNNVISEFLSYLEQSRKEVSEQKKNRINLLFSILIFLFFIFLFVFLIILFAFSSHLFLKKIILIFAIIFSIVEVLMIFILYK